ncbi:unnamed protein product [Acanthoscelides obtectus]|uniref:Uncharacterized protein n=1 Tax=Acanthoscelides obtectus TaxID=200917 RepID=A0A9P0JJP2_ACAOB|nr:unnamed protein product [Acanthoscelides obtectus]CAK1649904.1 hypothetical protein AOBTE_LOCUS16482 [Acanthoscelides obtectus]
MIMSKWNRALVRSSVLEAHYDESSVRVEPENEDSRIELDHVVLFHDDLYSGVQIKEADVGQPCIECDKCEEGYEPHDWRIELLSLLMSRLRDIKFFASC